MNIFSPQKLSVRTQTLHHDVLKNNNISVHIRREDEIHAEVSGNKYRKLKYNLLDAKAKGFKKVLTFGGAYSNHICATAFACRDMGLQSVGIIRGAELVDKWQDNPTLLTAHHQDMQFDFITRSDYKRKHDSDFLAELQQKHGDCYLIPEGGTNTLAVKGCSEIITLEDTKSYDVICCAVGTGGTLAGIINSVDKTNIHVIGFSALKAPSLVTDIEQLTKKGIQTDNWHVNFDYTFGGYAKTTTELFTFIDNFQDTQDIILEPIYTGKMLYGVFDLIHHNHFTEDTRILVIHTGGLQGLQGFSHKR